MSMAVQDTLRGQTDALFESRGDINRRLQALEQEILTIQELLANEPAVPDHHPGLTWNREGTRAPSPRRTDTEPGQMMSCGHSLPAADRARGSGGHVQRGRDPVQPGANNTARVAFQQFLQQYPNDPLAPNAQYYLADILVQENRLEEAVQAFLRIPEFYAHCRGGPERPGTG